jgi:hypothetical protein
MNMKLKNMKLKTFSYRYFNLSFLAVALFCVIGSSVLSVDAQKRSKAVEDKSLAAESADLDQCRNGALGSEEQCSGSKWANGNLNPQNTHYKEGDSVPYRYKLSGLTPNTPNQITIGYDTIQSDRHAIDYLTTFNRTETTADPCSDILSAPVCASPTVFKIPVDPNVVNGNLTGNQIAGNFTFYGGTITSVSGYTDLPQGGGSVRTTITIFFTPTISNPILAVGGHIATRADWGADNSAVAISGSPYHMRLFDLNGSGGNQDRSLKVDEFSTLLTVIKDVANGTSTTGFNFTATAGLPAVFTLTDDGNNNAAISTPRGITSSDLGVSGTITVAENDTFGTGFLLTGIVCTGTSAANVSTDLSARQVVVNLQNNESVVCTFTNTLFAPTAAEATLSGRVVNARGRAIARTVVSLTDADGTVRQAMTNSFGYYRFSELEAGQTYVVQARHKQYVFAPLTVNLTDNLTAQDLVAQ